MTKQKLIKNLIKINLIFFGFFICGFIGNQVHANREYEYTNLNIEGNIKIDGTIDILEDFTTNFFIQKHGIIREIPLNYSVNGNKFHINLDKINVNGNKFKISKQNGIISIKIGDANKTVYGIQNYPISYSAYGLIKNFSGLGYAELYRNIVGNNFDTNINKVTATLYLPKAYTGFTSGDFLVATNNKSNKLEDFDGKIDRSQGNKIILTYNKKIPAGSGITIAIKFPNNYFIFDDKAQSKLIGSVNSFGFYFYIILRVIIIIYLTPILILICNNKLLIDIDDLFKKRKIGKYKIITQFTPPEGISPSEMSLLYYKKKNPNEISCIIYKRANEGRISTSYREKETLGNKIKLFVGGKTNKHDSIFLIQGKLGGQGLEGIELECWNSLNRHIYNENHGDSLKENNNTSLEGKTIAELPDNVKFSKNIDNIHFLIEKSCLEKGLIKNNSNKTVIPIGIGLFLLLLCSFLDIKLVVYTSLCIVVIIITFIEHNNNTEKGQEILAYIYGYKHFLNACEKDQLKTFIEQDPNYVDKILPYAAALGLQTKLINMIEPIYKEMGKKNLWYNGDISSLNLVTNIISSSVYNNSSASGGGFSVGGGGGGGGGHSR